MSDIEEGQKPEERVKSSQVVSSQDLSSSSSKERTTFIDYVPPPPRPIPPPAKYKLWLMVMVAVFFADWFSSEAKFLIWMSRTFHISMDGALFLLLGSIVGVLVYSTLDLMTFFLRIKYKGEWYGLVTWLKQPRTKWVHEYNNFFVQFLRRAVVIFEEGFAIFNAPKPPAPEAPKQFDHDHDHPDVVLKVVNNIRHDRVREYNAWQERFTKQGCYSRPGMKKVESVANPEKDSYTTFLTFGNIDQLNEYMTSPVRERYIRNLQPLLATPEIVQLQKERNLPDAFTDLCTSQGHPVPKKPPKRWKVWFLTTVGLFFVILWTKAVLPYYFAQWGLDQAHERAQAFVRVFFNTYLNTYFLTPLLIKLFGDWLKRMDNDESNGEPWRTLDNGFKTIWGKLLLTFIFYGGCVIAWVVNAAT